MRFQWDLDKAARNERLHGVSFEEACELFTTDAPVLEVYDVDHSETEDRFRWATRAEQELYAEYVENLT